MLVHTCKKFSVEKAGMLLCGKNTGAIDPP